MSQILEVIRDTGRELQKVGVMDLVTLRKFDPDSVPPVAKLRPAQIQRIRETSRVSRVIFARLLNTSASTVPQWEIGQKRSAGITLKPLTCSKSAAWMWLPEARKALFAKPARLRA